MKEYKSKVKIHFTMMIQLQCQIKMDNDYTKKIKQFKQIANERYIGSFILFKAICNRSNSAVKSGLADFILFANNVL